MSFILILREGAWRVLRDTSGVSVVCVVCEGCGRLILLLAGKAPLKKKTCLTIACELKGSYLLEMGCFCKKSIGIKMGTCFIGPPRWCWKVG